MKEVFDRLPGVAARAGWLAVVFCGLAATWTWAQTEPGKTEPKHEPESYASIRLVNMIQMREANEVQTDLRNMLPKARIYYVGSQNTLTVEGTAEDLDLARKMVADLDLPRKNYRITFTLADVEGGKRTVDRSYSMVLWGSERSMLKQGQRVPITTVADKKDSGTAVQVQYVDIGTNLQASLEGRRLWVKVEETAVDAQAATAAVQDPVVKQTVLEASTNLQPGAPVVVGSLAVPGSSMHQEVTVQMEAME